MNLIGKPADVGLPVFIWNYLFYNSTGHIL